MKRTRIVTTLAFMALIALSWTSALRGLGGMNMNQRKRAFEKAIQTGDDYMERGLYQLAIEEYQEAVDLQDSVEIRDKLLNAFECRYSESVDIETEYLSAAKNAVDTYPDNENYYVTLLNLFMEQGSYYQANKYVTKAIDRGLDDQRIQDLKTEIRYGTTTGWDAFSAFRPCSCGTYAVQDEEYWRYITASGASTGQKSLLKAFSIGDEGIRLQVVDGKDKDENDSILLDGNGVLRGKLLQTPQKAGVYSEGLIAICYDDKYSYYDSLGDVQFGSYQAAGVFQERTAAVSDGETFYLINQSGELVSDKTFTEIKMDLNGFWLQDHFMLAADNGGYHLYKVESSSIEQIGDMAWKQVDLLQKDKIFAFENGGKWGFANVDGEVLIEPAYEEAKSFSGGLAAVKKGSKWGFINSEGEVVIDYQYSDADYFNESGSCMVKNEETGKWQLISLRLNN